MADLQLNNQVLDWLIIALLLIVIYFLLKPREWKFQSRVHKLEKLKKEKELDDVKRVAMKQLNELLDKKGKLQRFISDAKKRYMKGEITYEAMQLIVSDCEQKLFDLDEKLMEFEGTYNAR